VGLKLAGLCEEAQSLMAFYRAVGSDAIPRPDGSDAIKLAAFALQKGEQGWQSSNF
jgi:hypothetical protein